jgi:hypothetical protein
MGLLTLVSPSSTWESTTPQAEKLAHAGIEARPSGACSTPGCPFNLKKLADYETGPGSQVSAERAQEAIQTAQRFVDCVTSLIPPPGQQPEPDRSR